MHGNKNQLIEIFLNAPPFDLLHVSYYATLPRFAWFCRGASHIPLALPNNLTTLLCQKKQKYCVHCSHGSITAFYSVKLTQNSAIGNTICSALMSMLSA